MFVLNSDEICVYQLLCNGTEILIQCFNSIPKMKVIIKLRTTKPRVLCPGML